MTRRSSMKLSRSSQASSSRAAERHEGRCAGAHGRPRLASLSTLNRHPLDRTALHDTVDPQQAVQFGGRLPLSLAGPPGYSCQPPPERAIEQREVRRRREPRDDEGALRVVQVALRDQRAEIAVDAAAVAHVREPIAGLRGARQRLLRAQLFARASSRADERVGDLAECAWMDCS